jgi:arginine deiminase
LLGLVRGGVISENFRSEDAEKWIRYFTDMGRIRHFSAGSGAEDVSMRKLKLVDFLRQRGFNVLNVGGVPPEVTDYRHLIDVVLHEHERQAANVVATARYSQSTLTY